MVALATSHIAPLMQSVESCYAANFYATFYKYFFIKIARKLSYFCKKMYNFRALGAPPPDPRASSGWGFCPQTPSFRQQGASHPDPHISPPPYCEILATCLIPSNQASALVAFRPESTQTIKYQKLWPANVKTSEP